MSPPLRVMAVDDEPLALADLGRMLRASPQVADVVTAGGGEEALDLLSAGTFDLLLLDVRMPGLDGVRLARVVRRFSAPPALVFVTAHESAAVAAFELRAVDYLLKPVGAARLEETLRRVRDLRAAGPAPGRGEPPDAGPGADVGARGGAEAPAGSPPEGTTDPQLVPVDSVRGGGTRLVPRRSILYVEARGDHVRVVADEGRFLLRARLGDLADRWGPDGFVRVHRGYLANLPRAVELDPQLGGSAVLRFGDGSEVPVARREVAALRRMLRG